MGIYTKFSVPICLETDLNLMSCAGVKQTGK
jgi:hypothetical protein